MTWLARLILLAAAAALFVTGGNAGAQQASVREGEFTIHDHLIAGETRLRAPSGGDAEAVALEIRIDEQGSLVSARLDPAMATASPRERADRFLPAALALVRQWRFRPVVRDGRAVPARGIVRIDVLPPERRPRVRRPFPAVPPASVEIAMLRDGCFGTCPVYEVTIRGDGSVRFVGGPHTLGGTHEHRIAPAAAQRLIARFRDADFWSLDERYRSQITDNPATTLIVRAGRRSKQVVDYIGENVGMPAVVTALEEEVDALADTARWVGGNERTIAALEGEGYYFRSDEAAQLLLRTIENAPESLPLALIDRGVPLETPPQCDNCPWPTVRRAALAAAVRNRRVALFDRLAAGTSLSPDDLDELLQSAAHVRSVALVERLLARGAPLATSARGSALVRALEYAWLEPRATMAEQQEVMRLILARMPAGLRAVEATAALARAAWSDPSLVRMLLAAGADVNARPADGGAPLLYVTEAEDIALLLLAAGADRTLRNAQGHSLAEIARANGWTTVQAMLAAQ